MWIVLKAAVAPYIRAIHQLKDGADKDMETVKLIRVLARYKGDYDLDDMAPDFILASERCKLYRDTAIALIEE